MGKELSPDHLGVNSPPPALDKEISWSETNIDLSEQEEGGEKGIPFSYYWKIVLKRKWQILAVIILVSLPTALHLSTLIPLYRASATMLIEQKKTKMISSIEDIYRPDTSSTSYLQTQFELMTSRYLVEEVIRQERLDMAPEFNPRQKAANQSKGWKDWVPEGIRPFLFKPEPVVAPPVQSEEKNLERFSNLVSAVTGRISISPIRSSQLVNISFVAEDPVLAARVATTLAQTYIDQQLEARLKMTQHASSWLMERLTGLRSSLEEAESKLKAFREKTGIISSLPKDSIEGLQLSSANELWMTAKGKRGEAEVSYDRLVALTRKFESHLEDLPMPDNQLVISYKKELNKNELLISDLSNRYGPKHPKIISAQMEFNLNKEKISAEIKRSVATMAHELTILREQEEKALQQVNAEKRRLQDYQTKVFQFGILEREVATNRELYDMFLRRFKETGVSEGMEPSDARIVDQAQPPKSSFYPNKRGTMAMGFTGGVILGFVLALLLERMDTTIRYPEQLDRIGHLSLLATVPLLRRGRKETFPFEEMLIHKARSIFSETIRELRTSILFSNVDHPHQLIMVTSSVPSEGKTTLAINLAYAFVQNGERVLLLEADFRKPRLFNVFHVADSKGVYNIMMEDSNLRPIPDNKTSNLGKVVPIDQEWLEVNQEIISSMYGLHVLHCGKTLPFPTEVLSSRKWLWLLNILKKKYDRIIIDTPPVLAVADARIIGSQADAVIVVVGAGKISRQMLTESIKILHNSKVNVVGFVLNSAKKKDQRAYQSSKGYGYGYGYGAEKQEDMYG